MIFTKITQNIFAIVKKEGVVPFKIFMNMTKVLFMYLVSISTSNKNTKIQKKTYLLWKLITNIKSLLQASHGHYFCFRYALINFSPEKHWTLFLVFRYCTKEIWYLKYFSNRAIEMLRTKCRAASNVLHLTNSYYYLCK